MPRVKGSIIIPFVKAVRADKSGSYDNWLTEEDRGITENRVFPSSWYPMDFYRRLIEGVVEVAAHGNKKLLYHWGLGAAAELLSGPYKNLVIKGSPEKTIDKYLQYKDLFFDFGRIEAENFADNRVLIVLSGFPNDFESFYLIFHGWFASIIQMSGAKNVKSKFVRQSWAGASDTAIEFTWD